MKEKYTKDCGGIKPEVAKGNGITELVFIIDRSGSMEGLEEDTIGGFNSALKEQQAKRTRVYVSTILFSNCSKVVHDRVEINKVKAMKKKDYKVGGCTALLDAIGDAIHHIANIHKYARPEDVPEHTIFIITTDGYENASHRYSSQEIKKKIQKQTEKYGWEFLFAAANIDAVETAKNIGIRENRAANYSHNSRGVGNFFSGMNKAITHIEENYDDFYFADFIPNEKEN